MFRKSAAVLLVATLLVSGCKKKNEDAQGTAAGGGESAVAEKAAPAAAGTANAVNWEKVERVPFATLQSVFPESLAAMKRTDLSGSMNPGDDMYSEASADFEGENDSRIVFTIQDNPTYARGMLSSKTSTFKGYPVVSESESSSSARLEFVVGDRFYVVGRGDNVKVADIKSAFDKVDLAKLASWKNEGLK